MNIEVILITTIVSVLAGILAIGNNIFHLRDRFVNWRKKRKRRNRDKIGNKKNYIENHPSFEFSLGYVSNSPLGTCTLSISFLNLSFETKFIEPITYEFEFLSNKKQREPNIFFSNSEVWPKRLEHGQRFAFSLDFQNTLSNNLFRYWKKGVQVYAVCHSSTGDYLRSDAIGYDELVKHLVPLKKEYSDLAKKLAITRGGSLRDIEASLWQLQLFDRITVHVVRQLQENNIPSLAYLNMEYGLVLKNFSWTQIYTDLENKKIAPIHLINYLEHFV
ncbi:hypothetical protein [Sunxiuqinia dokdonensis]|uniref:Uncharacterized protein n=1 Tax=Sunxiuqinia dokdonensis TaxID=1409788 RepID=A0A0L8V3P6_9BACT|nr:hypothetical protein [Sunxiuqinia dokdonensis]KOH42837.1 hypothetical protein NC99_43460 [Sunxiuqinia dokdonensis]